MKDGLQLKYRGKRIRGSDFPHKKQYSYELSLTYR